MGDTLMLSGVDLVDGTPIVDVKPFVPFADGAADATVAPWLRELPTPDLQVVFSEGALAQLEALAPHLRLLKDADQARRAVGEVLAADPRSVHWRQSRSELEYGFSIDTLNVVCRFEAGVAHIVSVQRLHLSDRSHLPGRTEAAAAGPAEAEEGE